MVVGLGTGSTAAHAIRAIGRAVDAGLDVQGIPTSYQSRALAREVGIPVTELDAGSPDLAIDGADQVVGNALVKGGGGAHAREKVVDTAADRFVVVVDEGKETEQLDCAVPVECMPHASRPVAAALHRLGGEPELRAADHKDGPIVTDNGNLILDCDFGRIGDPGELAADLSAVPGVLEHGLFVDLADEIHIGHESGVEVREV